VDQGCGAHGNAMPQVASLHAKNLLLMPARVALALQADGWILRQAITWCKPSPMPGSVRDRPTNATEMMYLFSRSPRYFYDMDAVRVEQSRESIARRRRGDWRGKEGWAEAYHGNPPKGLARQSTRDTDTGRNLWNHWEVDSNDLARFLAEHHPEILASYFGGDLANFWRINSESFSGAHFATFPRKLVEPCILAGTSEKGACSACGAPWVRVVEREGGPPPGDHRKREEFQETKYGLPVRTTTGWKPTCACDAPTRPCVVLDPFGGSGTVNQVAEHHGRLGLSFELSEDYYKLAKKRNRQLTLLTP